MLNEIIGEIDNKLNQIIDGLNKELAKLTENFKKQEEINNNISRILNDFSKTRIINFDLLEDCLYYLSNKGVKIEKINYRVLNEIRSELILKFPDRVSSIDNKFDELMKSLSSYSLSLVSEYKHARKEMYRYNSEIEKCMKLKRVLNKILCGNMITKEEFELLDEIKNYYYEPVTEIYFYATKNNSINMIKTIEEEKQKIKNESLSNLRKRKAKSTKPIKSEIPKINEEKQQALTQDEKSLIDKAKKIVEKNDISDKTFLNLVTGCTPYEILDFVNDYNDPRQNIALILSDIIIPGINSGTLDNVVNVLNSYIIKYESEVKKNDISYKLSSIKREDIINDMKKANNIINLFENSNDTQMHILYQGYISNLFQALDDLRFSIIDDELFESGEFEPLYEELKKRIEEVEKIMISNSKKETTYDKTDENKFYQDSCNFIVFPDGIDFSKKIDEDDTLTFQHKKKILNGLKRLSMDDTILSSSRHKVKDDDSDRYKTLRSFRGPEYRIVYKVSRASGLEKVFGKKMNVIFALNVGYGATSDKSEFYNESKDIYDITEGQIQEFIDILNSDDLEEINKLVNEQLTKLNNYIISCVQNIDSIKTKGGV